MCSVIKFDDKTYNITIQDANTRFSFYLRNKDDIVFDDNYSIEFPDYINGSYNKVKLINSNGVVEFCFGSNSEYNVFTSIKWDTVWSSFVNL